MKLFDPLADPPCRLQAGDRIRFFRSRRTSSTRRVDAVTITVLKPGALSQLQDLGRYGYQRYGVVVGGAMDEWAHRMANALVGNDENEATLEITLTGPTLRFDTPARIAVCGADLSPRVDGAGGTQALPHGRPVDVAAGSQLRFGARVAGVRAYLAVAGGFDVPLGDGQPQHLRARAASADSRAGRCARAMCCAVRASSVPAMPGGTSGSTSGSTSRGRAGAAENAASTLASLTLTVPASPVIVPVPQAAAVQTDPHHRRAALGRLHRRGAAASPRRRVSHRRPVRPHGIPAGRADARARAGRSR